MDNLLEILRETYLIDNLLSSSKLNQEQFDEFNTKLNQKFSKNELKEFYETLPKLNNILKDKTNIILQKKD